MLRAALLSCFLVLSFSASAIKLVQFNIQEFDSVKIQDQKTSLAQVEAVKFILNTLQADILSLNEIQYDLPTVPNQNYLTTGQNLQIIARDLLDKHLTNTIFFPANTGKNALRNENNEYVRDPSPAEAHRLADPVNFGLFPGQYSTGALTHYPILATTEINALKWKEFNPDIDLSAYADEQQNPFPEDMPLFDKNFTDTTLLIEGRPVHVILLHTVPSFAFGNPKSPNFVRNRDQLLFLKRYLEEQLPNQSFIAMGDWNTDINQASDSATVLKDLGEKYHYANDLSAPTYRGMNLLHDDLILHLDYILLSKDIGVKESGIFAPVPNFKKLGCQGESAAKEDFILVNINEQGQTCAWLIEKNYFYSKTASDHLAIWADIYFKE